MESLVHGDMVSFGAAFSDQAASEAAERATGDEFC